MKIIHTGDLHLDSVMESNFTSNMANERRGELLVTFGRMVNYAQEVGARVFLIAGDLFDTPTPTPSAELYVMQCMADHPEIDFLCLGGNHMGDWQAQNPPANFHTFPTRNFGYFRYENVVIGGTENNAAYHELNLSPDDINIIMLHGQISDAITDLSVINLRLWQNRSIDYLALGHLHRAQKDKLDERGTWAYCGTPEGRGFDEAGTKGFMLLETQGKKLSASFIPFARRTIHLVTVDISRLLSQRDIENGIIEAVKNIPQDDIVRVILRGVASPEMHKNLQQLNAAISDKFYFSAIQDESNISLRPDSYEHDKSLKGEFVRTVMKSGLPRADIERIIRCGIQALEGEEIGE